jgi:hypothetical protein
MQHSITSSQGTAAHPENHRSKPVLTLLLAVLMVAAVLLLLSLLGPSAGV